jgi:hypothetical protein
MFFNVVMQQCFDPQKGDFEVGNVMRVASEQKARENCKNLPDVESEYFIEADTEEDAHSNLWGEKVGRRIKP